MVFSFNDSNQEQAVLWDFRQFYVEWARFYIQNFSKAHLSGNYPEMLKALKKWHSIMWGRTIKDFEINNARDETFDELSNKIISLSNKKEFRNTFLLKEKEPRAVAEFDEAVDSVVVYLVFLMKKNKLFGHETINRGL